MFEFSDDYRDYHTALRLTLQEFCVNCHFWYPHNVRQDGQCRYSSPTFIHKDSKARWPVTKPGEGCGDFEPLVNPEKCDCDVCRELQDEEEGNWNEREFADLLEEEDEDEDE